MQQPPAAAAAAACRQTASSTSSSWAGLGWPLTTQCTCHHTTRPTGRRAAGQAAHSLRSGPAPLQGAQAARRARRRARRASLLPTLVRALCCTWATACGLDGWPGQVAGAYVCFALTPSLGASCQHWCSTPAIWMPEGARPHAMACHVALVFHPRVAAAAPRRRG